MTEEDIKQALAEMEQDGSLNTQPHSAQTLPATFEMLSFQEWHLIYLTGHPKINAQNYLTNLRVMIKVRP